MSRPKMRTYYSILDVEEQADSKMIVKAYRKHIQLHHPDLNHDGAANSRLTRDLNRAKEVLTDATLRRKYDDYLRDKRVREKSIVEPPIFKPTSQISSAGSSEEIAMPFDPAIFNKPPNRKRKSNSWGVLHVIPPLVTLFVVFFYKNEILHLFDQSERQISQPMQRDISPDQTSKITPNRNAIPKSDGKQNKQRTNQVESPKTESDLPAGQGSASLNDEVRPNKKSDSSQLLESAPTKENNLENTEMAIVSKSESTTTLRQIANEMDKFVRQFQKEYPKSKTTLDRQQLDQLTTRKILDWLTSKNDAFVEFSLQVKDVAIVGDHFEITATLPKDLEDFVFVRKPMRCNPVLLLRLNEIDESLVRPKRTITVRGQIYSQQNSEKLQRESVQNLFSVATKLENAFTTDLSKGGWQYVHLVNPVIIKKTSGLEPN